MGWGGICDRVLYLRLSCGITKEWVSKCELWYLNNKQYHSKWKAKDSNKNINIWLSFIMAVSKYSGRLDRRALVNKLPTETCLWGLTSSEWYLVCVMESATRCTQFTLQCTDERWMIKSMDNVVMQFRANSETHLSAWIISLEATNNEEGWSILVLYVSVYIKPRPSEHPHQIEISS